MNPPILAARRDRNFPLSFVIASEAKQSIHPCKKYGLLRRFAPRNDGT